MLCGVTERRWASSAFERGWPYAISVRTLACELSQAVLHADTLDRGEFIQSCIQRQPSCPGSSFGESEVPGLGG
jgi:hypothetical protein